MAAEPPRPPPRNLLFCGPPPTLPRIHLLPCQSPQSITNTNDSQMAEAYALNEINNVGVPTFEDQLPLPVVDYVFQKDINDNHQDFSHMDNRYCLRRTQSFDSVDFYGCARSNNYNDSFVQSRRSEPDLSKFSLFVEAEVTLDYNSQNPPPLVLNNPFYVGSYALDTNQNSETMVALPDNYLAFEDSFVPTWNYGQDLSIQGGNNYYYDGVPIIPPNDPWSTYGIDNMSFPYLRDIPESGVQYMPLNEIELSVPEYMSLPVMEQAVVDHFVDGDCNTAAAVDTEVTMSSNKCAEQEHIDNKDLQASASPVPTETVVTANDDKISCLSNKFSPTNSEDSFTADISNDVTSSLAFIPNSFVDQLPMRNADDTSDATSPSSNDYQEASALDIVQSLDELSTCDSTDFSQSRDDVSPVDNKVLHDKVTTSNNQQNNMETISNKESNNNQDHKLTTIACVEEKPRIPPPFPPKMPQAAHEVCDSKPKSYRSTSLTPTRPKISNNTNDGKNIQPVAITKETTGEMTSKSSSTVCRKQPPPRPPAVPPAWLTSKSDQTSTQHVPPPQIFVQDVGTVPQLPAKCNNVPATSQKDTIGCEPKPSCSYAPPQPSTSQLKSKEVEVSHVWIFNVKNIRYCRDYVASCYFKLITEMHQ